MNKIEDSLNKLTTIPKETITSIFTLTNEIICDEFLNCVDEGEDVAVVDVGIGTVSLFPVDGGVEYKFVPSDELEKMVVETMTSGDSPLVNHINKKITKIILTKYKNLM